MDPLDSIEMTTELLEAKLVQHLCSNPFEGARVLLRGSLASRLLRRTGATARTVHIGIDHPVPERKADRIVRRAFAKMTSEILAFGLVRDPVIVPKKAGASHGSGGSMEWSFSAETADTGRIVDFRLRLAPCEDNLPVDTFIARNRDYGRIVLPAFPFRKQGAQRIRRRTPSRLAEYLSEPDAPGIVTPTMLEQLAGASRSAALGRIVGELVDRGDLIRLWRGLYRNAFKTDDPFGVLPHLVPQGFLTASSVLQPPPGDGASPHTLHVAVPASPRPQWRERELEDGTRIRLHTVPKGTLGQHVHAMHGFNEAYPERALCDWLYIRSGSQDAIHEPPADIEAGRMDRQRMLDCARLLGVEDALERSVRTTRLRSNA